MHIKKKTLMRLCLRMMKNYELVKTDLLDIIEKDCVYILVDQKIDKKAFLLFAY